MYLELYLKGFHSLSPLILQEAPSLPGPVVFERNLELDPTLSATSLHTNVPKRATTTAFPLEVCQTTTRTQMLTSTARPPYIPMPSVSTSCYPNDNDMVWNNLADIFFTNLKTRGKMLRN